MFSELLDKPCYDFYDMKSQLARHVYSRSQKALDFGYAVRDSIISTEGVVARQKEIAAAFLESIGGLPSTDTPLNPQVTGTLQCEGYRIEKIIFESRPKAYVTANMYIPDNCAGKTGAVLLLCGHTRESKQALDHQRVCCHLVSAGLVVLIIDPIGQGERLSYYNEYTGAENIPWGTMEHDYAGVQCLPLGDSIAKYFVHDAIRAIDYLISRPEVDACKIGVTGASGGGTQTAMLMMCDRRVAAAAPCIFITNREEYMYSGGAQDAEQIWPGMTIAGFDHEDILLAMAPKPVLILAGAYDFFPFEGTKKTFNRVKRFWDMYGKNENIELYVEQCIHSYTLSMAVKTAEFFSFHLLGKAVAPDPGRIMPVEDPKKLWCTKSGQVKAQFPDARFVYEENLSRLKQLSAFKAQNAAEWLRSRIMDGRCRCEPGVKHVRRGNAYELSVSHSLWWSQKDLLSYAHCFRSSKFTGKRLPVTIALWEGGTTKTSRHMDWLRRECESGREVMVLDVTGCGALEPHPVNSNDLYEFYGTIHKLANDLIWLGDSLPAIRAYDVIRAVDALNDDWPDINTGDIKLFLNGRQGLYGYLAALIDKRICKIEADGAFDSFAEWVSSRYYDERGIMEVVLPGILKFGDIKDLLKLDLQNGGV